MPQWSATRAARSKTRATPDLPLQWGGSLSHYEKSSELFKMWKFLKPPCKTFQQTRRSGSLFAILLILTRKSKKP